MTPGADGGRATATQDEYVQGCAEASTRAAPTTTIVVLPHRPLSATLTRRLLRVSFCDHTAAIITTESPPSTHRKKDKCRGDEALGGGAP